MANYTGFPKPCMTNLPRDIGEKIFKEILSSPVPDYNKMHQESVILEQEMKAQRDKILNAGK